MRRRRRKTELYHYGIVGQQWGLRRYQNEDGSLTAEGKARFHAKYMQSEGISRAKNHINTLSAYAQSLTKQASGMGSGGSEYREQAKKVRQQARSERERLRAAQKAEREQFAKTRAQNIQNLKDLHAYYQMNKRYSNSIDRFANGATHVWRYNKMNENTINDRIKKLQSKQNAINERNNELLNKYIDDVMSKSYMDVVRQRIARLKRNRR